MVPFSGIHLLTYLLVYQILLTNKETSNYDLPHISLLTGHPNYAYPFRIGWRAIESDSHGRGKDEWKQYAKGCSSCYRETGKASRPGSGPGSWDALSSTTTTAISRLIGAQIGVKRAEITGKGQRREHYFSTDLKRNIF